MRAVHVRKRCAGVQTVRGEGVRDAAGYGVRAAARDGRPSRAPRKGAAARAGRPGGRSSRPAATGPHHETAAWERARRGSERELFGCNGGRARCPYRAARVMRERTMGPHNEARRWGAVRGAKPRTAPMARRGSGRGGGRLRGNGMFGRIGI